jgi:hypothetical protein
MSGRATTLGAAAAAVAASALALTGCVGLHGVGASQPQRGAAGRPRRSGRSDRPERRDDADRRQHLPPRPGRRRRAARGHSVRSAGGDAGALHDPAGTASVEYATVAANARGAGASGPNGILAGRMAGSKRPQLEGCDGRCQGTAA